MCLFSSCPIYLIVFVKTDIPLYLGLNGIFIPCPTPRLLIWESAFLKSHFYPKYIKGRLFILDRRRLASLMPYSSARVTKKIISSSYFVEYNKNNHKEMKQQYILRNTSFLAAQQRHL